MQDFYPVIAIFQDSADEADWGEEFQEIPGLLRIMSSEHLSISLANLGKYGAKPSLIIITSQVYQSAGHTHLALIRRLFQDIEMLLVARDNQVPPLKPLASYNIRHLVVRHGNGKLSAALHHTVAQMVAGQTWQISNSLREGTLLSEYQLNKTEEKEQLIAALLAAIPGDSEDEEMLREKGALLADEMLENAFYGAPRCHDGRQMFRKGEQRALFPSEKVRFRFGFDGEVLAMEVADNWGSLPWRLVLEHLASNQDEQVLTAAGGRGLFIIWRFFDQLLVKIAPGRQTVVGGHVRRGSPLDPLCPKSFHICMQQ